MNMLRVLLVFCSLIILLTASSCSKKSEGLPPNLLTLAEEFKKTPISPAKIEIGSKIHELLPSCIKDVGGGMMVVDVMNPTYKLYKKDLFLLLGQPDIIDPEFYLWKLGDDEKTHWALLIEIHDGYVTAGRIDIESKGKK